MNVGAAARGARWLTCVLVFCAACRGSEPEKTRATPQPLVRGTDTHTCRTSAECGADAYCRDPSGLCGRGQAVGTCASRARCEHAGPVCGCDGEVHDDACAAHDARVDLDVTGRCTKQVEARALCGAHFCDPHTQYCELYLSDVFTLPGRRRCRQLPPACRDLDAASRSCECFPADTPCLSFCGPLVSGARADGGPTLATFHLTCQGVHEPAL